MRLGYYRPAPKFKTTKDTKNTKGSGPEEPRSGAFRFKEPRKTQKDAEGAAAISAFLRGFRGSK
jgi:hypothetical protein